MNGWTVLVGVLLAVLVLGLIAAVVLSYVPVGL